MFSTSFYIEENQKGSGNEVKLSRIAELLWDLILNKKTGRELIVSGNFTDQNVAHLKKCQPKITKKSIEFKPYVPNPF